MVIAEERHCSLACPGIEVVTVREDGAIVTTIHGGRLDGEQFRLDDAADLQTQHQRVCRLARMAIGAR